MVTRWNVEFREGKGEKREEKSGHNMLCPYEELEGECSMQRKGPR
jgi:hypothetical protein